LAPGAAEAGPPAQPLSGFAPSIVLPESNAPAAPAVASALLASVSLYAVPAAAIAVPGVIILVWVALQTVGALAWIPAVRRLRGRDASPYA
ncbi:MAG: hypothetical protein M3Y29_06760, partial [Chloroflexota bacterium]|nr:hypothetical protein [Chloroflexota bacterium]